MKSRLNALVIIVLTMCVLIGSNNSVYAAGNGTGGGKNSPLSLVSSSPAKDQKDFPVTDAIKLTFSKNVVNLSVLDNNKKSFEMVQSDGTSVPFEVITADDQVKPEENGVIQLKPVNQLRPGTKYTVKILPTLKAKSGATLDEGVQLNFITASTNAGSQPNNSNAKTYLYIGIGVLVVLVVSAAVVFQKRRQSK